MSAVLVGPFVVPVPEGWEAVTDGLHTGVLVFDLAGDLSTVGERPESQLRPNVVLRFFTEESGGGVMAAAPRELFAEHALRPCTLVLAYDYAVTGAGLPVRRHHVVVDIDGQAVHSVRWYVGLGDAVLEMTLTFDEPWFGAEFWAVCDRVVSDITSAEMRPGGKEISGPIVPESGDRESESILAVDAPRLEAAESLDIGLSLLAGEREPWLSETEAPQDWLTEVAGSEALLRAEGVARGRPTVCEAYQVDGSVTLRTSVTWGSPGAEQVERRFLQATSSTAVLHMMAALDVRAGWQREVIAHASAEENLAADDVAWDVIAGGERAVSVLHQPRDVWIVRDRDGELVAHWLQPDGKGLLAVLHDDEAARLTVGPVDGWTVYLRLLEAWWRAYS